MFVNSEVCQQRSLLTEPTRSKVGLLFESGPVIRKWARCSKPGLFGTASQLADCIRFTNQQFTINGSPTRQRGSNVAFYSVKERYLRWTFTMRMALTKQSSSRPAVFRPAFIPSPAIRFTNQQFTIKWQPDASARKQCRLLLRKRALPSVDIHKADSPEQTVVFQAGCFQTGVYPNPCYPFHQLAIHHKW